MMLGKIKNVSVKKNTLPDVGTVASHQVCIQLRAGLGMSFKAVHDWRNFSWQAGWGDQ